MIYTITFSPSIDYIINNDQTEFNSNGLTRFNGFYLTPGGKGINASYILNQLDIENQCIIFNGATTKPLLNELLLEKQIKNVIGIETATTTRINIKYFSNKNKFELNGPNPIINKNLFTQLLDILTNINQDDIILIMGKCDENILIDLIKFIRSKKAQFAIDIDSEIILEILKYKPLLIKPNIHELSSIFKRDFKNDNEIYETMNKMQTMGALNIIVSNGSKGSFLLDDNHKFYCIKLKPVDNILSTVGAGDTLFSSFIGYKYIKNLSNRDSFIFSTCMSIDTSTSWYLADHKNLKNYLDHVEIFDK